VTPSTRWPGYFEAAGRPCLLVGSGEPSGAVLNGAFDFDRYLDTFALDGLSHCRVFSGVYREREGDFDIADNVLAPVEAAFLSPWLRRPDGWYDLFRWNDDYWLRLRTFCRRAAARGIVVEYVLFCHWYRESAWEDSPMHPARNIQGIGPLERWRVYRDPGLLRHVMLQLARKAADELAGFDHVIFEVCNEPYTDGGVGMGDDFHGAVCAAVREVDPDRLLAINVANGNGRIDSIPGGVAVLNFHYAIPDAVRDHRATGLVIADDETGFLGSDPAPYRAEGWRFLLAGGGAFENLDYGFTVGHPGGDASIDALTPGSGGPALRRQLGWMRRWLENSEIWNLHPREARCPDRSEATSSVAGNAERVVGWVSHAASETAFDLEPGAWVLDWYDPTQGGHSGRVEFEHPGGLFLAKVHGDAGDRVFRMDRRKRDGNS